MVSSSMGTDLLTEPLTGERLTGLRLLRWLDREGLILLLTSLRSIEMMSSQDQNGKDLASLTGETNTFDTRMPNSQQRLSYWFQP